MSPARPQLKAIGQQLAVAADWALVGAGILIVGFIDWITGTEIRVSSFYFAPMAWAGWRLKRPGVLLAAAATAGVWALFQYAGGVRYTHDVIWIINLFSQGVAFLTVGWLMAMLAQRFESERALSRADALTGLHNRRGLMEKGNPMLVLCRRYDRPVALACIDLDNFKRANDTLGHAAGDQVLIACATVFKSSLRSTDLVARLGGDEFLVLLPETPLDAAVALMERIRQALLEQPSIRAAGVTATIGVIADARSDLTLDALMARADAGLYEGKQLGKNRVFATNPA